MKVMDNEESLIVEFEPQETEYMVRQFGAYDAHNLITTHVEDILNFIYHVCVKQGSNVFARFSKQFAVSCKLEQDRLCVEITNPAPERCSHQDNAEDILPPFGVAYKFSSIGLALDAISVANLPAYAIYKRDGAYYVYVGDISPALLEFSQQELEDICLPDNILYRFEGKEAGANEKI